MVAVEDGDEKKQDGCCKVFWKFMFSHIGLCAMVVLYCVAGGFIFEHLERENEKAICTESENEYTPMQVSTATTQTNADNDANKTDFTFK